MGKRADKSVKGGGTNSATSRTGDDCSTPEPYSSTGNFVDDFAELWQRSGMDRSFMPQIRTRVKIQPSFTDETKTDEGSENMHEKSLPSTYIVSNNNHICRPNIQVEYDVEETKQLQINHAKEIFIRSWKLEDKVLNVLQLCSLERLQTLNLWNVGITEASLRTLAAFLPTLPSLKTLVLDGNPIPDEEPFHILLSNEILIQNLSLRNNDITNKGAESIGRALGDCNIRCPLLALNLSFNKICDKGAVELAKALRMNRTLLSLSLASNQIGDDGCRSLAEVLQRFPLIHDEVILRRFLIAQHSIGPRRSSGPDSRRGEVRPGSNKSGSIGPSKGNRGSSKKKPDPKKADASEKTPKKDDRVKKGGAAATSDATKGTKGKKSAATKDGSKRTNTISSAIDVETVEVVEYSHPLLDSQAEQVDGKVYIPGCFTLVNLNLSRNCIGSAGLEHLWTTTQYQANRHRIRMTSPSAPGLFKLSLQKNLFDVNHPLHLKIQEALMSRDPLSKAGTQSPDDELQSVGS